MNESFYLIGCKASNIFRLMDRYFIYIHFFRFNHRSHRIVIHILSPASKGVSDSEMSHWRFCFLNIQVERP